jgi:hypothetical protein
MSNRCKHRVSSLGQATLVWLLGFSITAVSRGQGPGADCPSPVPCLEREAGWTLYWHDPCNCVGDPCLLPTCPTANSPNWYFLADFLPLFRDQLDGSRFQVDGTTGQTALQESDFSCSQFSAGARLLMGCALGDWYRLEASYLGSYSWDDIAAVRNLDANGQAGSGGGNLLSPFSNFGSPAALVGVDFNNFAQISFSSEMDNVELNLRRRLRVPSYRPERIYPEGSPLFMEHRGEASFLLGIRYLSLEERFQYLTESDVPAGGSNNQVNVATDNHMIGAQIGLLYQFLCYRERGWVDLEAKGGLFNNRIKLDSRYLNTDTAGATLTDFADDDERDCTSFLGELSLIYNHQIAPSITFRAGYNAIWVTDVALASENFNSNLGLVSLGPALANGEGDVVFHGPSLGLVWAR